MDTLAGRAGFLALAVVAGSASASACRAPTQIELRIHTDVPCAELGGVTLTVGAPSAAEQKPPSAQTLTCAGAGDIGTLIAVPSDARDAEIAVKVVAGRGLMVEDCTPPDYGPKGTPTRGCIVARRAIRFLPHEPLVLPIELRASCVGVACAAQETCVRGLCRSSTVDDPSRCTSPEGCSEDALFRDTQATARDAGSGGANAGGADAGSNVDGGAAGAGADGGIDAGGGGARRVFVTSKTYSAGLGGLAGADAKCQALADAVKLGGSYKAWLSDSKASPSTRYTKTGGPFVLVNGALVANDWADLTDGVLANAINVTESGQPAPPSDACPQLHNTAAWTTTAVDGTEFTPGGNAHCTDWTSGSLSETASIVWGSPGQSGAEWTYSGNCNNFGATSCSRTAALYCFEQ